MEVRICCAECGFLNTDVRNECKACLSQLRIGTSSKKLKKNKIVYALACNSLVKLGPLAIKNGAKAYIGYNDEFMWVGDPSKSSVPDKDKNSAPFRRVCHLLVYSLLKGMPVKESIEKTKLEYIKLIRHYGTSEDNFGDAPAIGLALSWNLLSLDIVGNPNAAF